MPILDITGRKTWRNRLLIGAMYGVLGVLGVAMVYPLLITLTSAGSNAMDYDRFSALPRSLWSRHERFVKGLVPYFPSGMRLGMEQLGVLFEAVPPEWGSWQGVGRDPEGIRRFAQRYLDQAADPARWAQVRQVAADYDTFARRYPLDDTVAAFQLRHVGPFLARTYERQALALGAARGELGPSLEAQALALMSRDWGMPYDNFFSVNLGEALQTPWDLPNYVPRTDGRTRMFQRLAAGYRDGMFLPKAITWKWARMTRSTGLRGAGGGVDESAPPPLRALWADFTGAVVPACETRPTPLKLAWINHLNNHAAVYGLPGENRLTVAAYNATFDADCAELRMIPFPVPANAPLKLRQAWEAFVQERYPRRLIELSVTADTTARFRAFLRERFRESLALCNQMLDTHYADWEVIALPAHMPLENFALATLWGEFVGTLPFTLKRPLSAEAAYQDFLLARYGSLEAVNQAYGTTYSAPAQIEMPFDLAYLVTFIRNERALAVSAGTQNFSFVLDYMVRRGRAVLNTAILIVLSLLAALTINPLAAYALSRFQMRHTHRVVLFLLATMAFPAAVTMIPGFLLTRDLGLLNTYTALILPGVASGMGIFMLKGFFDSLPPELYEAAAIDGAREWQVFLLITLPLSKPILAVIALNSFMAAYNSWEWALVVCQKQEMWTLAVWLYQFSIWTNGEPWLAMASFVLASLPVFLVFLFCQKIILRGIVLPQMK